ncbi:MAG: acetyl/propionyl/methylcrotonyl-CoA carboxylase subunit alpha [Bacteroidales bacterium]
MKLFDKILIANRGEIALRILRTARRLGIRTVAIYSHADRQALHALQADEAWYLGQGTLRETYLNIPLIIEIALRSGAEAIHPGYGFLSENPDFAAACEKEGITFIGPHAGVIRAMGNKIEARNLAVQAGLPVTRGFTGSAEELLKYTDEMPWPVLIKAAAGGGGKGMRIARSPEELAAQLETTSREAESAFGDGTVYVEQYIENPRHIEVQVIADKHGNVAHLWERECTLQRRYQKVIEEAPSPTLSPEKRQEITSAAVALARSIGYVGAGTLEFLYDTLDRFYFLEMNTRIQVEHPVTEIITGLDIVEEQIRIAAGYPLSETCYNPPIKGHSIECRIYAEDPETGFMPSPGDIRLLEFPSGMHTRIDSAYDGPGRVEPFFDPMIAKLIVHAPDRDTAIHRMQLALREFTLQGIKTNLSFLLQLTLHPDYQANKISTSFIEKHLEELNRRARKERQSADPRVLLAGFLFFSLGKKSDDHSVWSSIGFWRLLPRLRLGIESQSFDVELLTVSEHHLTFRTSEETLNAELRSKRLPRISFCLNGHLVSMLAAESPDGTVQLSYNGHNYSCYRADLLPRNAFYEPLQGSSIGSDPGKIYPPMPGKIVKVMVKPGDSVNEGTPLLIIESMKMENTLKAAVEGIIKAVHINEGEMAETGRCLIEIE